jgi:hypothetical protein
MENTRGFDINQRIDLIKIKGFDLESFYGAKISLVVN